MDDQDRPVIAFVLYPGITPLDLVGPLQVLSSLPDHRAVVVAERVEPLDTEAPIGIVPSATFDEVPDPSVLLVPGGGVATIQAMGDTRLRDYLLGASEGADVVGSICTGALILAAAGLLDGRSATTHWAYHGVLERLGARYVTKRWVEDGRFISSAGVSAGIDMSLHLAARLSSEPMARYIQLWAEYDPEPPFGPHRLERGRSRRSGAAVPGDASPLGGSPGSARATRAVLVVRSALGGPARA